MAPVFSRRSNSGEVGGRNLSYYYLLLLLFGSDYLLLFEVNGTVLSVSANPITAIDSATTPTQRLACFLMDVPLFPQLFRRPAFSQGAT